MPEIKTVCYITRQPRDGDPGSVELGHYMVADGFVVMCDDTRKLTGKKVKLNPGDDAKVVAGRATKEAWSKRMRNREFNRPLRFDRLGLPSPLF
jgi:hypothetical protein